MMSRSTLALLLASGALGTLSRYWLAGWIGRSTDGAFPWGTFTVNALGCFIFGLLASLAEARGALGAELRIVLCVGFLGAFTTFSTFAHESMALLTRGQWGLAVANVLGQNAVGLAAVFIGGLLGRSASA